MVYQNPGRKSGRVEPRDHDYSLKYPDRQKRVERISRALSSLFQIRAVTTSGITTRINYGGSIVFDTVNAPVF